MNVASNLIIGGSENFLLKDYFGGMGYGIDSTVHQIPNSTVHTAPSFNILNNNSNSLQVNNNGIVVKYPGMYLISCEATVYYEGGASRIDMYLSNGYEVVVQSHRGPVDDDTLTISSIILASEANWNFNFYVTTYGVGRIMRMRMGVIAMGPDTSPVPASIDKAVSSYSRDNEPQDILVFPLVK